MIVPFAKASRRLSGLVRPARQAPRWYRAAHLASCWALRSVQAPDRAHHEQPWTLQCTLPVSVKARTLAAKRTGRKRQQNEQHGDRGCCSGCRWCSCCGRPSGRSLVDCSKNRRAAHGAVHGPERRRHKAPPSPDTSSRRRPTCRQCLDNHRQASPDAVLSPKKNRFASRRPQKPVLGCQRAQDVKM